MIGQAGHRSQPFNTHFAFQDISLDSGKNVCTIGFFGCKGTLDDKSRI